MDTWSPVLSVQSKARPGVSFTIRRLTARTRALLNLALAETQAKLLEISRDMEAIREDIGRVPLPGQEMPDGSVSQEPTEATVVEAVNRLKERARKFDEVILMERNPALFTACLVHVDGFESNIAFEPGRLGEAIYAYAPADLSDEILAAIESEYGLGISGDDAKNSESLTTSGAVVDGATQHTTA